MDFDLQTPRFKVVLLGEGAVGKSSILLRYTEDIFNLQHFSTLQAAFATKQIIIDGKKVELNIWDTAGQEKFHALGPIYYRDSQGAILVYDITDSRSFERVKNWVLELKTMLGDAAVLFIVGNKIDMNENRHIGEDEARDYATSVGAFFQECSAKENISLDLIFDKLTIVMLDKAKMYAETAAKTRDINLRRHGSRRSLRVVDDAPQSLQSKKSCC